MKAALGAAVGGGQGTGVGAGGWERGVGGGRFSKSTATPASNPELVCWLSPRGHRSTPPFQLLTPDRPAVLHYRRHPALSASGQNAPSPIAPGSPPSRPTPRVQPPVLPLPPSRPRCLLPDTKLPGLRSLLDESLGHSDPVERVRKGVLLQQPRRARELQRAHKRQFARIEEYC